jgi:hypothetical protein
MARSSTPSHRIEFTTAGRLRLTNMAWESREWGRPTAANLAKYVGDVLASFQPGGTNSHAGPVQLVAARIIRQSDDSLAAKWTA